MIVICGPGGVGKGTVVTRLLERDDCLWLSRSWTTRAQRPGEPDDAYVFVDRPTFEQAVAEGRFLEWAGRTMGNLYGTPIPQPDAGQDVLLEIDVAGAEQVRRMDPEALVVLLVPPSVAEQEQRLRGRGDSDEAVAARLAMSAEEVERGRRIADAVVVNDDLERTCEEVLSLIRAGR